MAADRTARKARAAGANDVARDDSGGGKRDLASGKPDAANNSLTHSRLTDTLRLAHRFASRFPEQPEGKRQEPRRTEPAQDNASYRKDAKPLARKPRISTKKV